MSWTANRSASDGLRMHRARCAIAPLCALTLAGALPASATPPQVSVGNDHALALARNGAVYAWGGNFSLQLGLGGTNNASRNTAQSMPSLPAGSGVIAVSAGSNWSLALKADGTVLSWGSGSRGRLGDTTNGESTRSTPGPVSGLGSGSGVIAISAGPDYGLALKADGSVWVWGSNDYGHLGNNTLGSFRVAPAQIAGLPPIRSVSAGRLHALAVDFSGRVWIWGTIANGEACDRDNGLNNSTRPASALAPTLLVNVVDVSRTSAGPARSLFTLNDGTVGVCGTSSVAAVCHDRTANAGGLPYLNFTLIPGATDIRFASAGEDVTYLHGFDGQVRACGANDMGQFGSGSTSSPPTISPTLIAGLNDAALIESGAQFSIGAALACDGRVRTWGPYYQSGILGDGSTVTTPRAPTVVKFADGELNLGADPGCSGRLLGAGFEAWDAR